MLMSKEEFTRAVGREPEHDDLERCNCREVGKPGHMQCGVCKVCGLPCFMCTHLSPVMPPKLEHHELLEVLGGVLPNIDDFSVDHEEVYNLSKRLGEASRGLKQLSHYAEAKSNAMQARLLGNIEAALRHERHCELAHGLLPEWAKW